MAGDNKEGIGARQAPPCPGGFLHQIRSGDTLYALASRFGTTVDAVLRANPGTDPASLRVGQLLCIPTAAVPGRPPGPPPGRPPGVACPGGFLYQIRAGDTFYAIARAHGMTVDTLRRANPGVNPSSLRVGQLICIPTALAPGVPSQPACPAGATPYIIRRGDTFYGIARRFRVSVAALTSANPGVNPGRLQIGQLVCIPPRAGR